MTKPKEPTNGSKSDQNILFLSEMIVYFRPTCAGWPCITKSEKYYLVLINVSGYRKHRIVNELAIDIGKNFDLSSISHSTVLIKASLAIKLGAGGGAWLEARVAQPIFCGYYLILTERNIKSLLILFHIITYL
jgi:hypothetical protein